jgi:hypothetical protein
LVSTAIGRAHCFVSLPTTTALAISRLSKMEIGRLIELGAAAAVDGLIEPMTPTTIGFREANSRTVLVAKWRYR